MQMETLHLRVLTPDGTILDKENVGFVRVHMQGDTKLSVYPNHAPLIAELLPGPIQYSLGTESHSLILGSGIMHVFNNGIYIYINQKYEDLDQDENLLVEFDNLAHKLMDTLVPNGQEDDNIFGNDI
jgi:F0F1-type ATP synthase epsilon subunit